MALLAQEKITITIPSHIKKEVLKLKKELHLSMNAIYQKAITEYVEKQAAERLRQEAASMLEEYHTNPEIQSLNSFEEDIHEY